MGNRESGIGKATAGSTAAVAGLESGGGFVVFYDSRFPIPHSRRNQPKRPVM
ncbi:hypothetical protein LG3211_3284 [Lysobacter gummosus]|nr:hypothetical protein LG3211_3284 [Lysobacter gummosus]